MTWIVPFLSGCLVMGYAVAAVFFFRFWRDTRDVLFGCFAAAFSLLAVVRALLPVVHPPEILYFLRLVAFSMILVAIALKNR